MSITAFRFLGGRLLSRSYRSQSSLRQDPGAPSHYRKLSFMCSLRYLFLLLVSVEQLTATTYYVDYATGNDSNNGKSTTAPFKRCPGDPSATGVAASTTPAAGDTITFKGGVTYASGRTIRPKSSGSPANQIVYEGSPSGWGTGRAILDAVNINLNARSYITVQGFEIKNWTISAVWQDMDANLYTGTVINNNLIHDGNDVPKAAIYINSTQNGLVSNNEIYNIDYSASKRRGWGIHFHGRGAGGVFQFHTPNNVIRGNRIYQTGDSHISIFGQNDCIVTENVLGPGIFSDHSQGITYYYNTGPATITRNFYKGDRSALTFEGMETVTPVLVANNIFDSQNNVGYVIASWGPGARGELRVINNVIIGSANHHALGFGSDTYSAIIVKNNIVDGIEASDHSNNLFVNAGAPSEFGAVYETDPSKIFVDHTAGDYRLKPGSLAIGKGTNVSVYGVTTDFVGATRTVPYDIGAFKFDSPLLGPTTPATTTATAPAPPTNLRVAP
jgi:Right handed beta helix region